MDQTRQPKTEIHSEECENNEGDAECLVGNGHSAVRRDKTLTKTVVPLLRAFSKQRRIPREKNNEWITTNLYRRKCICYIAKNADSFDAECQCGLKKSLHSNASLIDDNFGMTKWTADQCTKKFPTDAYGEVEFPGTGSQNRCPFVRLSDDTDAKLIIKLLRRWGLKIPNLVISVTGGAKSFELTPHLKEVFRRGLMKAAKSTGAWIVTGGTNDGVMKHVGEAVKEHQLMLGPDSDVKVIGIASWGQIQNKKALIEPKKGEGRYPAIYSMAPTHEGCSQLDPNHTHFILVDDGTRGNWGGEIDLRSRVEKAISIMERKTDSRSEEGFIGVPVVLLVLEGGPNTIKTMYESIMRKVPAVVIDGSGRAANVVAFAYSKTIKKIVDGQKVREIDPVYESEIRKKLLLFCEENKVNQVYEWIKGSLKDETMVSVYRFDNGKSQDIDLAILKALLKAKHSSDKLAQLNLALAWNRIDLAKSSIFTDDFLWTTNQLSQPMFTALLDDKADFVELFLQNGLSMKEFLTTATLCKLYAAAPVVQNAMKKHQACNMQIVGRVIQNLIGGTYTSQYLREPYIRDSNVPPFVSGENIMLNTLEQRRISLPNLNVCSANNERIQVPTPYRDAFICAVLCNRRDLARVLWEGIKQPVAAALMACKLLRSLAKKAHSDETNTNDLQQHAQVFEERAIGVLDECFKEKEKYCQPLLARELDHFGKLTCLDLAVSSESENFISHTVCQRFLTRLWMGVMTMNNSYKKVVLCMFLPFLIPLVISFVDEEESQEKIHDREQSLVQKTRSTSDTSSYQTRKQSYFVTNREDQVYSDEEDGREETGFGLAAMSEFIPDLGEDHSVEVVLRSTKLNVHRKFSGFYDAPITKFVGNVFSHVVFIILYAYVLMINFPKFDGSKSLGGISAVEILLYLWVLSIVIEEFRQIASKDPQVFFHKIRLYFCDPWNWNSIDILSVATFLIAIVLRFISNDKVFRAAHVILTVGMVLFIARSLQMFFVNRHLGPRLVMISKMMKDLLHFVLILLVFLVAYGISLEAVMYPGPGQYARNNTWKSIQGVLELPYWQMYGELFLDEIKGKNPDDRDIGKVSPDGQWLSPLLLALFMLVANVLLLNLLIAIFSNTFQGIQEASDKVWRFQRYDLINEYLNKPLLPPPLILISHVFVFIRWIWRLCQPSSRRNCTHNAMKLPLQDFEKEQIDNWAFQARERYTHQKQKDSNDETDERLKALEERFTNTNEMLNRILKMLEEGNSCARPTASSTAFVHHKARTSPYPGSSVRRFEVPDNKVDWKVDFPGYDPVEYTAPSVLRKPPWADADLMRMAISERPNLKYNQVDDEFNVNRASYTGTYEVIDGLAMNPMGRTGMKGRGLLGRFGPNHAADPIVTRWKQANEGVMVEGGKKVLEFVAILRRDCNQWAIPGGMVEPGMAVSQTLKAEFGEEALAQLDVSPEERKRIAKQIDHLFQHGDEVYKGYVDDPRNTDNAWMETIAVNFHDDKGELFGHFKLQAGDDAAAVKWQRVSGNIPLYASHASILKKVAKIRNAAF